MFETSKLECGKSLLLKTTVISLTAFALFFLSGIDVVRAQAITEGFDNIATLPASGWYTQNNSTTVGSTSWFQGNTIVFSAQAGAATNSYIGANFNNAAGSGTISNWLLTPNRTFRNGDTIKFWTRGAGGGFPDRLEVRLSTNGASTNVGAGASDVGDFTVLLLSINPNLTAVGYPEIWTEYTITISGLAAPTSGRIAFRYFVPNGGPTGSNGNYIGIDTFSYTPTTILDSDNDGIVDESDNCPTTANPDQLDTDGDSIGDACDSDDDGDAVPDTADNCPLIFNPDQADFDLDGIGDTCDAQTGPPQNKDQCKNGGWARFDFPRTFRNQGDCIQFVNTGR